MARNDDWQRIRTVGRSDRPGTATLQGVSHLLIADHLPKRDAVEHRPDLGLERRSLQCERNVKLLTLTCEIFVQLLASQVENGLILGRGKRVRSDFSLRSKTNPDKPTRER